jgi:hypothetical protein
MTLSTAQQAALAGAVARTVYFIELQFLSSTQRICSANQTITWGGYDWLGLGAVGSVSAIEESDGLESKPLTFTLSAAQPTWLALAVGAVEEYRGRIAKMYFCPLDESYQMVGTPEVCWRGVMSVVSVGIEGGEGKIQLRCETSAYGLKRQPALRMNDQQQRKKYPTDSGFIYLQALIADSQSWLSKRYQSV